MLDHMLFNKLKWFNLGKTITTVDGKDYCVIPSTVVVPPNTPLTAGLHSSEAEWIKSDTSTSYRKDISMTFSVESAIVQIFTDTGKQLIYKLNPNEHFSRQVYVLAKDCQIGGANSPLSHLYQVLRAFIARKAVSAC